MNIQEIVNEHSREIIKNIFSKLDDEEKYVILELNNQLQDKINKIDKAIECIKDKLSSLNMNKSAIMRIVEPSSGHLLADVNYEIQKWKRLLEILGDKENE